MKIDSETHAINSERLQAIARAAHAELPDHCGFILLVSPFGDGDNNTADYISNVNREDAIKILKTLLFGWGYNDEWMKNCK